MSRIHDALKKAAQDRAANTNPVESHEAAPPVTQDWNNDATAAVPPRSAGESLSITKPSADYLRFEDLQANCARPEWHPDPNLNVFFNPDLSAHAAEQFRTLRSRLYQLRDVQSLRTVLVTSSVLGEGKTFVTSNLALAIVRQPERRVLIIDGDLRCGRLHTVLGAPAGPGLSDYLRGDADEVQVIQRGPGGNVFLIPAGSEVTNPSELLSNRRFKDLLDRVGQIFDWVIVDSPPCLPVADVSIMGGLCDGVLLVVRASATPAEVAKKACQELKARNVVGVVLNAVKDVDALGAYYAHGYGYVYGQKESRN
jgi:protein-tyrosine kinase